MVGAFKKRLKFVEVILLAVVLAVPLTAVSGSVCAFAAESCSSEIVLDASSLRILSGKNENLRLPNASTTKIVTAITVIENTENLDKAVEIPKEAVGVEGSSIYLVEGEKMSVRDLLYGLMLQSGNDAATALAIVTCGNVQSFTAKMNELVKDLNLSDSHFENPHGLHSDNHYTSAYDLAVITAYALKNEDFRQIVSTKSVKIPYKTDQGYRYLKNKNKMLQSYDGAIGVKTGYTKKAGRCLVTAAQKHGMTLVSVVLNKADMWQESATMLDKCFASYKPVPLYFAPAHATYLETQKGDKVLCLPQNSPLFPLTESEAEHLRIGYDLPDVLPNGVNLGEKVGKLDVYCGNRLIFSADFITMQGK